MIFTIDEPVGGSFTVEIKDGSGATVYGPTIQTNAPFTVSITDPGAYIMYVTYAGSTNGWCFTIPECACPVFEEYEIITSGSLTYMKLYFSFPAGFCPFAISGEGTVPIEGATIHYYPSFVPVATLSALTDEGGGLYSITLLLLGYGMYTFSTRSTVDGTRCEDDIVVTTGYCDGPSIASVTAVQTDDENIIRVVFDTCGDTCQTFTINYTQISPVVTPAPSGTYSTGVLCDSLPYTIDRPVTPVYPEGPETTAVFAVEITDCCGNTYSYTLNFTSPECDGPRLQFVTPYSVFFKYAFPSSVHKMVYETVPGTCAGSCTTATISYTQVNVGIAGLPDSGTITHNLCATNNFNIHPNTSYPGYNPLSAAGRPRYNITVTTCCGEVFTGFSD